MKYAWIELHGRQWPVSLTCQVLGVGLSGFHARKARDVDPEPSSRCISNDATVGEIIDWLSFYNHSRLHSTLNCVSPMQFEQSWHAAQQKQAA